MKTCPTASTPTKTKAKTSRKCSESKKERKSRRVYDFDYDFLSQFFHMPQKQAAELIEVSVITIKRNCKRHGFKWPYRANKYKNRNKPVLSDKARAFHELPLVCMKEQIEVSMDDVAQQSSECETDTESIEDDELVKKNFCEILFMLKTAAVSDMSRDSGVEQ
ncbi:RWP-RK domain [Phytophthora infestans]|uniref:RWP-RK domain n=1 Tax=Phytophthora infestans TaxID=4787 RepID=A0A833WH04_PHYIN|nr:RWP-RK domain [Phytophthora infestans]KAF4135302.1 RWP-RK domain [Phytophthora infestans]KAI9982068.1 hypothetical protein PInf_007956 [Phytophthora infestans]